MSWRPWEVIAIHVDYIVGNCHLGFGFSMMVRNVRALSLNMINYTIFSNGTRPHFNLLMILKNRIVDLISKLSEIEE